MLEVASVKRYVLPDGQGGTIRGTLNDSDEQTG